MSDSTEKSLSSFSEENRVFVEGLRDPDEEIRLRTLAELDEVDDELADELLRVIRVEGDEAFRADVAISLGPTLEICDSEVDAEGKPVEMEEWWMMTPLSPQGFQRITEGLHRIYLDGALPKLIRRRVLEASIRSPRDWHEGAIRSAWASGDGEWQATAVFCMGFHWGVDFSAEVVAGSRSEDIRVRCEAIRAAGRRGVTSLGGEILEAARDESQDPEIRYAAVEALPYLEVAEAERALEGLLESPDLVLREIAEEALEDLSLERMADRLDEGLDLDPEELF
jgi:HEAT repeat protein